MNNKLQNLNREILIRLEGIKKNFGSIIALRGIDLTIYKNEVLGIIGDNGAGKSTLMKIISGVYTCNQGQYFFEGDKVNFKNPKEARQSGISIIYQELALAEILDVKTNVFMGKEIRKFGLFLDDKKMEEITWQAFKKIKSPIKTLDVAVENLSGGQQRAVAIARQLVEKEIKLLIMDEPTAGLGAKQTAEVINLINSLKKQGISIIFISHILSHILDVSDRIVVLVSGEKSAEVSPHETSLEKLIDLMLEKN